MFPFIVAEVSVRASLALKYDIYSHPYDKYVLLFHHRLHPVFKIDVYVGNEAIFSNRGRIF